MQDRLLHPSIPVGFLDDALLAGRYRGWDTDALLRDHGLSPQHLQLPGPRISIDLYSRVLGQLRHRSDDAFLGFLSHPVPARSFGVFSYSVVGCRNLEEFIDQANAFYGLLSRDFDWQLERDRGDLLLLARVRPALPVDYRFIIQCLLLMCLRLFGWLLGENVGPKAVNFSFDKNATDDSLAYLFGSPIHHGCEADFIRLDGSYGGASLSCNRDQIAMMLQSTRHLFLVNRRRNPLSQEVRRRLLLNKSAGWLDIAAVAAQLSLTEHQLWRKLKREGGSFLEIRDQIKRDWALTLLEDAGNSVEQVAERLHYADVSAFRKAFRKWTGLQPLQYRRKLEDSL